MIVLAHRGLWRDLGQRNTSAAFTAAWVHGFGIESDVRDHNGHLVISHDPPVGDDVITFDAFLDSYVASGTDRTLALNIKADGLQAPLLSAIASRGIDASRYFVFDMAVPDALGYLHQGTPCFTRQSEIEPLPAFLDQADGVWLDCFHRDWIDAKVIGEHLQAGRRVALVSPELHGRNCETTWSVWKKACQSLELDSSDNRLILCTDFPERAGHYFNE